MIYVVSLEEVGGTRQIKFAFSPFKKICTLKYINCEKIHQCNLSEVKSPVLFNTFMMLCYLYHYVLITDENTDSVLSLSECFHLIRKPSNH